MKTLIVTKFSHYLAIALLILSGSKVLHAKSPHQQSKKFETTFSTSINTQLTVENRRGNIELIGIEGSEGRVEATLTVRGDNEEEIDKVIRQFELETQQSGSSINVNAEDHIKSWSIINSLFRKSNTIKFDDKSSAKDIEEIEIAMVVYLPKINLISAKNRYHDIVFSDLDCDLDADLYSGKLRGSNIKGDLELDMKYGEVRIGSFHAGDIDIYDCNVVFENGKEVKFKSKYSDIVFRDLESMDMDTYDDEIELGNIEKHVEFEGKYSNIEIGNFGTSTLDLYDSDLKGKSGNGVDLRSKYGSFDFENIKNVELRLYDDNFEAESIEHLKVKESKYSEIKMDNFKGKLDISSTYQDDIRVLNTIVDLGGLYLDGKYTTLQFPIASETPYILEAETKYGNIDISRSFNHQFTNNSDNSKDIKGLANGATDGAPKVIIKAYDSKLRLH